MLVSTFYCHFFSLAEFQDLLVIGESTLTKLERHIEQSSAYPIFYFGLLSFWMTMAQRQMGLKHQFEFCTYWPAVGHLGFDLKWVLTIQRAAGMRSSPVWQSWALYVPELLMICIFSLFFKELDFQDLLFRGWGWWIELHYVGAFAILDLL